MCICLTTDIKILEIFSDIFDAFRKDRAIVAHGGVFIAFKRDLLCTEAPELDCKCEIIWCKLNIISCTTLYLGSFYLPLCLELKYLEDCNASLYRIMSNKNANVLGDSNCGDIEWRTLQVHEGVQKRPVQTILVSIIHDHCLSQMINIHNRENKTLNLLFTNSPSPINRVKGMHPIGKADHDIIYIEYDI